jgi:hypothetical protein
MMRLPVHVSALHAFTVPPLLCLGMFLAMPIYVFSGFCWAMHIPPCYVYVPLPHLYRQGLHSVTGEKKV